MTSTEQWRVCALRVLLGRMFKPWFMFMTDGQLALRFSLSVATGRVKASPLVMGPGTRLPRRFWKRFVSENSNQQQ